MFFWALNTITKKYYHSDYSLKKCYHFKTNVGHKYVFTFQSCKNDWLVNFSMIWAQYQKNYYHLKTKVGQDYLFIVQSGKNYWLVNFSETWTQYQKKYQHFETKNGHE